MRKCNMKPHARQRQRGVAAVEFAFIATIMIVILMGLFVWWRYFQAHQSLVRAAGDGARMASSLIAAGIHYPCDVASANDNRGLIEARVRKVITDSLQQSSIPGDVANNFSFTGPQWICPGSDGNGSFSFYVQYQLPPLLGGSNPWLPEPTLIQIGDAGKGEPKIVVHFQSMT